MIEYVTDESDTPLPGEHWLSPAYQPLPVHTGVVSYRDGDLWEEFLCAGWYGMRNVIIALEMMDRRRTKELELQAARICGWILQTFRWSLHGPYFMCRKKWILDDCGYGKEMFRKLMTGSVELAIMTPSGADMAALEGFQPPMIGGPDAEEEKD